MSLGDIFSDLVESGSVLRSKWPNSQLSVLERLIGLGAVRLETKARGARVITNNHTVLMTEIFKRYPSWPEWKVEKQSRSESVLLSSDAHSSSIRYPWIGVRCLTEPSLGLMKESNLPVQVDNSIFTSILEDSISDLQVSGRVLLVENFESFMFAERLIEDLDVVVYYAGTMSEIFVDWVGEQNAEFVFAPDYDPVGMWQYHRVAKYETVCLFIPNHLNLAFEKYSNSDVYANNPNELIRLSQIMDPRPDLANVLELMKEHRAGVMQELFHSEHWLSKYGN